VTSAEEPKPLPQIRTPERWTAGVYANGIGVWFTKTEFDLDFLVSLPHEQATSSTGDTVVVAPVEVVARVKIPPQLVFEVLRNLADQMDMYEKQHGKIPEHGGQRFGTQPDIGGE
jgi:Protein of unknown function (DUF3467)